MSIHWQPCTSRVAFSFWQVLRHKIIHDWKLDNTKKSIRGFVSQSGVLEVRDESFSEASDSKADGDLILCNTVQEFKTLNKQALLAETSADFCLLVYPNIKDSQFLYWFGFPAEVLRGDSNSVCDLYTWRVLDFKQSSSAVQDEIAFPFTVLRDGDAYTFPWFARRALARLSAAGSRLVLRCLDDVVLTVDVAPPTAAASGVRTTIGWEPDTRGVMCPRRVDLRYVFDTRAMADQAARLNLELMRWRMLPGLDLNALGGLKCLLIGAGTLGCHVARDLVAWGVRHITFVDGGRVALSNPVRQPLYEFSDAEKECWKAEAAAEALRRIHPSVVTEGHVLRVPMPGHPIHETERVEVERHIDTLERLIHGHDVVFLLTDTRESRWLPSLMARAAGKLALSVALGFDTWLVMRHGVHGGYGGCYFCLDCVGPKNTTLNRTLDQQCTVTRPGIAPIASATAVELLVSLLHHPRRFEAPADHVEGLSDATESPLGIVPHVVRGFMSHMRTLTSAAEPSKYCSACSAAVLSEFAKGGKEFIFQVCSDESILESVVGLEELAVDFDESETDF
jgi:molybdopterin/thiamine biosynthesis adenylyltransferase